MPTSEQCEAVYHCAIGKILIAAYQREFTTMTEQGRCKTKFPTFKEWYSTLTADQRERVDNVLIEEF